MNKQYAVLVGIAAAWTALPRTAASHHSYAQFDACNPVTVAGRIEKISWSNPHIVITVVAARDSAVYRIEWLNLLQLERSQLSLDALFAGDEISVTGAPSRDPNLKIITLLSELRRARDGWQWSQTRERPAACAEAKAL